jgi:hypothetical protein
MGKQATARQTLEAMHRHLFACVSEQAAEIASDHYATDGGLERAKGRYDEMSAEYQAVGAALKAIDDNARIAAERDRLLEELAAVNCKCANWESLYEASGRERDALRVELEKAWKQFRDLSVRAGASCDALRVELETAKEWRLKWETSEKWRKAYQEAKGNLYSMGGEIAEAATQHMPCNETTVDRWFRAEYVHMDAWHALRARAEAAEAHCAAMRGALEEIAAMDYACAATNAMGYREHKVARAALAATPAASLNRVKAEALREAAKQFADWVSETNGRVAETWQEAHVWLLSKADRIESEGA